MKRLTVFSFTLLCATLVQSQAPIIKVVKNDNRINEKTATGYLLVVDGKAEDIENTLTKFLKNYGKTRNSSDYSTISSPILGGIVYDGNVLYATTEGDDLKSRVWIGLDTAEWRGVDMARVLDRLEKMVYQFGVHHYRGKAQQEIDESQRAFEATEKQKLRLTNQNKDLAFRLGNNQQERSHLEKALETNKLEHSVLMQRIANNKKSQDSVANAGVQIMKVISAQKEKQKKIN